jgi:drug/metabolite transporter (DMT)-like permease
MPQNQQTKAELAALLVVTIWGTNFVFQKVALADFDAMAFTSLRFVGMIALSWLVLTVTSRRSSAPTHNWQSVKADLPRLGLAALLGYSLYMPLWVIGLSYTTPFSSALLLGIAPIFTALLLWLSKAEVIRGGQWLALLVALSGLLLFTAGKFANGAQLGTFGDLISLVSGFCYASYLVVSKPLLQRYKPTLLTAYTLTLGGAPVILVGIPFMLAQDWSRVTLTGWLTLGWSVIFPVYFAWTIWSWVNGRLGVARTSGFMYLVPVIGGVTSWLVLNESFDWLKIGGALLILGSLFLFRRSARVPAVEKEKIVATPVQSS